MILIFIAKMVALPSRWISARNQAPEIKNHKAVARLRNSCSLPALTQAAMLEDTKAARLVTLLYELWGFLVELPIGLPFFVPSSPDLAASFHQIGFFVPGRNHDQRREESAT